MRMINLNYLFLVLLALAACQPAGGAIRPTPSPSPQPDIATTGQPPGSAGQLAYIGSDGNVYVTTADRVTTTAITTDATAPWEGPGLSYQRIAWSPQGQLAYAAVTRSGNNATSTLYVTQTPGQPAQVVGRSDDHFVIYIYWSPATCPGRPACRQLAYLIEETEEIALRLVKKEGARVENRAIGFGWPFYFSWAADGESILWHTGTGQPDNPALLAHYHLARDELEPLPHSPTNFMAPAWSPQGDVWLGALATPEAGQLQLLGGDLPLTVADAPDGGTAFVWSPQGDRVAYAVRGRANQPFFDPIHIFDLETGQSTQLTDRGLRVLAFFWDPSGQRLGYLTRLSLPENVEWMQWRVYNLSTGADRGFKAFNPSLQMRFVMGSFNQYAQSHRFWSPDGRYLVYASRNDLTREEQVWLIDTWSEDGANAIFVDRGTMGFWSWQ